MRGIRKQMRKIIATVVAVALMVGMLVVVDCNTLYAEASGRPVAIKSCMISGSDVICQISTSSVPESDDGKFYVYADEVYLDGPTGEIVASVKAGTSVSVSFPLNYNTDKSNLSRKFLIAVKMN